MTETKRETPTLMDRCVYADLPVRVFSGCDRGELVFGFDLGGEYIFGRIDWEGFITAAYRDLDATEFDWVAE